MKATAELGPAQRHPPAPRLAQDAFGRLRSLSVEPRDAFVLSRIDGATLAHEIVDACGLDAQTVTEILNRLTAMGLIEWDHDRANDSAAPSDEPANRVSGSRMRTKRNVASVRTPSAELLGRFERLTHYQLLGVYPDCPHDEVERGHDRAQALTEGTLAARMAARFGTQRVLARVAAAYEVLRSAESKQKYDQYLLYREETRAIEDALSEGVRRASLVPPLARASSAHAPARASAPRPAARASAPVVRPWERGLMGEDLGAPRHLPEEKIAEYYLIAALRDHTPHGARRRRAEGLVRSAIVEREADNLVGAANALRLANSIVSDCDVLEGALATVTREMNKSLAPTFRAQAMYEENLCMWEDAAKTWEKVLLGDPNDARAARGVAEALLASGGDLKRARRRAEDAVSNAPDDAECQRTLARVYVAAGMAQSARRALDAAERLEAPENHQQGLFRRVVGRWRR